MGFIIFAAMYTVAAFLYYGTRDQKSGLVERKTVIKEAILWPWYVMRKLYKDWKEPPAPPPTISSV